SLRGATICRICAIHATFGPDTEARNGFAGGRVRVKLSLKIFQVKSKVQNIDFLKVVFRHADPPILGLLVSGADLYGAQYKYCKAIANHYRITKLFMVGGACPPFADHDLNLIARQRFSPSDDEPPCNELA